MKHINKWRGIVFLFFVLLSLPVGANAQQPEQQRVESDAFLVEKSGEWQSVSHDAASDGMFLMSDDPQASLTLHFDGTYLEVVYIAAPGAGTLAIEIDGVLIRTVITDNSAMQFEQRAIFDYLEPGEHMVQVYSSWGTIAVDAFVARPLENRTPLTDNEGPAQLSGTGMYYYYHGETISLEIVPDVVAVQFQQAITSEQRSRFLAEPAQPFSTVQQPVENLPGDVTLLSLAEGITAYEAVNAINDLRSTQIATTFEWVNPVYRSVETPDQQLILTDEIIVRYAPDMNRADIDELNTTFGVQVIAPLAEDALTFRVQVGVSQDALLVANQMYQHNRIVFAEPNFIMQLQPRYTPNDGFYDFQWHLHNTGQGTGSLFDADIDAPEAWDITRGDSTIIIAVLDDGVDMDHPDLVGKIVSPFDPYVAQVGPMPATTDGHGTAVAGIAGAETNNQLGIAGVCPECSIMPIRIFYTRGTGLFGRFSDIAAGIDHAWRNGAAVLNNSWNGSFSSAITDAFVRASINGRDGLGSIITVASGNDYSTTIGYPASLNFVITVGATNWCDEIKTPVSNACNGFEGGWGATHGPGLDISAPGHDIYTTDIAGIDGYRAGDYDPYFGGTSAATPVVSGVVGLILASNPAMTEADVKRVLYNSAEDVNSATEPGYDTEIGHGRVNAFQALSE